MAKASGKKGLRQRGATRAVVAGAAGAVATGGLPCGCAAGMNGSGEEGLAAGEGGRHAVGVDESIRRANLTHLRRIAGQVRGIAAMIEDDRYCADIITQVSAVRESLHAVARNLLRNHLKHCAAAAMRGEGAERDEMIDELLNLVAKLSR